MNLPRFSIVTISYNQDKYLEECITSVLNQSFKNFEYIVVDDGSTDSSREIILKYKSKLKYIFKDNSGPSDSLNKGFNLARGEIFYYINSDDYILKDSLSLVDKLFKKNNDKDIIYGNGFIVDEKSYFKKKMISTNFSLKRFKYRRANICQQATFIKNKAFNDVKGFNTLNDKSWDYELFIDIYQKSKKILRVKNFLGAYRIYPGTITSLGYKNLIVQEERMFLKYFKRKRSKLDYFIINLLYFSDRIFNFKFWNLKIFDFIESLNKKKII